MSGAKKKPPRMKPPEVVWVATNQRREPIAVCTVEGLCEACADGTGITTYTTHRYRLDEPKPKKRARK